jgi:hypothetical protein
VMFLVSHPVQKAVGERPATMRAKLLADGPRYAPAAQGCKIGLV